MSSPTQRASGMSISLDRAEIVQTAFCANDMCEWNNVQSQELEIVMNLKGGGVDEVKRIPFVRNVAAQGKKRDPRRLWFCDACGHAIHLFTQKKNFSEPALQGQRP